MSNVLIISLSDIDSDPRVDRQVSTLSKHYRVTTAGFGPPGYPEIRHLTLERPVDAGWFRKATSQALRTLRLFRAAYWRHPSIRSWQEALTGQTYDLIIVNDAMCLPLAFASFSDTPIVFDAHEYAPSEFELNRAWRHLIRPSIRWICEKYIHRTSEGMAVSSGIADLYERNFGGSFTVITNAPPRAELKPTAVSPERIRLVHWGAADPQRRLELMIQLMEHLDERFTLDLILVPGDAKYIEQLVQTSSTLPRIRFRSPVPMRSLPDFGNNFDLGVFLLPPQHPNQLYTLPNKFFEFVQARLGLVIGPSPEMADLVNTYELGVVASSFVPEDIAATLNGLSASDIAKFKESADDASNFLCAERNEGRVHSVVESALSARQRLGDC